MTQSEFEQIIENELANIERMAAAGFSLRDVSEALEVDHRKTKEMYLNRNSNLFKKYRKGFLQTQLELHERILKDAKNGSSPAQNQATKILENADYQNKI